jgi:hypothetical protein
MDSGDVIQQMEEVERQTQYAEAVAAFLVDEQLLCEDCEGEYQQTGLQILDMLACLGLKLVPTDGSTAAAYMQAVAPDREPEDG